MQFEFSTQVIPGSELKTEALPKPGLRVESSSVDRRKTRLFKDVLTEFGKRSDKLLNEIARELEISQAPRVLVILTSGLPDPYDAWSGVHNGEPAIFFNFDLWSDDDLANSVLPILKHELCHVLLSGHFPAVENSFVARLERLIVDEGIAHFVGFANDRGALLDTWSERWPQAEDSLVKSIEFLNDPARTEAEKNLEIEKSSTGSFWSKPGAIAGMFRAAKLYREQGASGLARAVRAGCLER